MISYKKATAMALEDAFLSPITDGIFTYLDGFEWIPDEMTQTALNIEYFYNRSGRKMASPLVSRMVDESGALVTSGIQQLAFIIKVRYQSKWNTLWETYSSSVSIFDTVNLSKEITGKNTREDDGTKTDTLKHGKVLTVTGSDTTTYDITDTQTKDLSNESTITGGYQDTHSGTDSATSTRTGSTADTEGGTTTDAVQHTGTVTDASTNSGNNNVYGFNSSQSVPSTSVNGTDSNTRTMANTDTTTTTHGKTNTTQYNNLQDSQSGTTSGTTTRTFQDEKTVSLDTGTDTHKKSGTDSLAKSSMETVSGSDVRSIENSLTSSDTLSRTESTSGYEFSRGTTKVDILKELYTNPMINNFFEIVYSDIDEILTCPIFV